MVMETYYRKRPKKTNHESKVSCEKEAEQVSVTAIEPPPSVLGRLPPPPHSSDHRALLFKGPDDDRDRKSHIKMGFLYEIDPKHLPPRTPVQLRSIRVAMVCEKTEMNVAVRFPSKESLKAFFIYSTRETHPALDEKFVMGIALANKVLVNLVTAQTFSEQRNLESFWLIDSSAAEYLYKDNNMNNIGVTHKKGADTSCLSDSLKLNGVVRWGVRRQVKYMGRHKDTDDHVVKNVNGQMILPSFIDGMDGSHLELEAVCDDEKKNRDDDVGEEEEKNVDDDVVEEEEKDDDDDGDEIHGDDLGNKEEEDKIIKRGSNKDLKRKMYHFRNTNVKKPKIENIDQNKKQKNKKKSGIKKNKGRARFNKQAIVLRSSKDRWSADRYKMAEENLLSVMLSKEATAEKPILRPQLRAEARKKIGDTGLLDHLLKHMAGKIAPGSDKRFRRRHNPDGAMEYWLENADLVNIRKNAGVTDTYWVPPPGWRPGDSPIQDPIYAKELKVLKDVFSKMERDFMAIKMQLDEVGKLRREVNELAASVRKHEEENNQAITAVGSKTRRSDISQRLDQLAVSLDSSKCDLGCAYVPVERYKEELMAISDFVKEIQEKLEELTARKEEPSLMMLGSIKEKNSKEQRVQKASIAIGPTTGKTQSETGKNDQNNEQLNVAAEKATKIERMKSGFRICKPQGTFLWPDMVKENNCINITSKSSSSGSDKVMVEIEVPTPPSVNSSTSALAQPPHQLLVKPLAEKRAVKVTVCTNYNHEDDAKNYTSNSAAAFVNLNNAPPKFNAIMPQSQVPSNVSSKNPWESDPYYEARKVIMGLGGVYDDTKEHNTSTNCCYSSLPYEVVGNKWLALSNLYSASNDVATFQS